MQWKYVRGKLAAHQETMYLYETLWRWSHHQATPHGTLTFPLSVHVTDLHAVHARSLRLIPSSSHAADHAQSCIRRCFPA